jgi:hypothetical protein
MVSIAINLLLAIIAIRLWPSSNSPAPAASTITNLVVITARTQQSVPGDLPLLVTFVTNRFHWRQIESTNYDEYVANLRGVGCPEKTVRDIIIADVEKHYESRREAAGRRMPFFAGGQQRRLGQRAHIAESEALIQQEQELIRRLLGIEWIDSDNPFRRGNTVEQSISRLAFGPLPEETFQRALATIGQYESLASRTRSRSHDILTDEDDAALLGLEQSLRERLAGMLTPLQLEEFQARTAAFEMFGENLFPESMELTSDEARKIALAKFAAKDSFGIFDLRPAENRKGREQSMSNAVANILGEKRFAEYQRAQEKDYQNLFRVCRDNSLSKDTVNKIYDIRKLTAEEVARIRGDETLDSAARQQRFQEIQNSIQREISGLMGARAYGTYLQVYGLWVTNVTKL